MRSRLRLQRLNPLDLGELAAIATAPAGRGQGAVQRVQVGSAPGADMSEVSHEGAEGYCLHWLQDQ